MISIFIELLKCCSAVGWVEERSLAATWVVLGFDRSTQPTAASGFSAFCQLPKGSCSRDNSEVDGAGTGTIGTIAIAHPQTGGWCLGGAGLLALAAVVVERFGV